MPSFGEKLKQEREKRKITLEEIAASTKIGTRMLQALEEDKFGQLPGGIFNKGFVRAYAKCVGLDEDQTVADYLQASGDGALPVAVAEDNEPLEAEHHPRIEEVPESPSKPLPWGWFAAGLLIVALALTFWSHRRREQSQSAPPPQPAAAATPTPAESQSQPASATKSPALRPSEQARTSASSTAISPSTAARPVQPASLPAVAASSPSTTKPASTLNGETPAAGEFVVGVQVREDSWVTVTADGQNRYSGYLTAGGQRLIHGKNQITVRVGNAGGVDLSFNGKRVGPLGEFGDVKTVTFGPAGIEPSPSPAPQQP